MSEIQANEPDRTAIGIAGQSIADIVAQAVGMTAAEGSVPAPAEDEIVQDAPEEPAEEVKLSEESLDTEPVTEQATEEKSPAPAEKQGSDEMERLRATARLGGIPKSTLESMSEADLRTYAKSKSKSTKDTDRVFQENAELKRQIEAAKHSPAPVEPKDGPTQAVEDVLDPVLLEELGEQSARALISIVDKKIAERETALQAKAAEAKTQEQHARSIFDAMKDEGEFAPGLPEFKQVLEKAVALSRADGLYADLAGEERARAVFLDAAKLLAVSPPSSPEPEQEKEPPAKTATVTRVPQRTVRAKADTNPEAAVERMVAAAIRGERDPAKIARKWG